MPVVPLPSTDNRTIDLSTEKGIVIAYFYPMTGKPGANMPAGWDQIPGARGIAFLTTHSLAVQFCALLVLLAVAGRGQRRSCWNPKGVLCTAAVPFCSQNVFLIYLPALPLLFPYILN